MQYSKIFSTLIAGALAVTGVQAQTTSTYRLVAEPSAELNTFFNMVSWVNAPPSSAYIGNVKFQQNAEPLIVNYNAEQGRLTFLSYHTERYQTLNIMKDEAKAISVDLWQGIPPTATQTGFTIDSEGYLGHASDNTKWALCPVETMTNSYQIYWVGGSSEIPTGCVATKIKAQNYGLCA